MMSLLNKKRSLTEDTCYHVDNHRDLLHGGDRPADRDYSNRSEQTGSMLSYTCNTGAHHQVKVQKPLALTTALPVQNEDRGVIIAHLN